MPHCLRKKRLRGNSLLQRCYPILVSQSNIPLEELCRRVLSSLRSRLPRTNVFIQTHVICPRHAGCIEKAVLHAAIAA